MVNYLGGILSWRNCSAQNLIGLIRSTNVDSFLPFSHLIDSFSPGSSSTMKTRSPKESTSTGTREGTRVV